MRKLYRELSNIPSMPYPSNLLLTKVKTDAYTIVRQKKNVQGITSLFIFFMKNAQYPELNEMKSPESMK
jgi:hypothetical protein